MLRPILPPQFAVDYSMNTVKNYSLIESPAEVEHLCQSIQMCYPPPVLGLDCEGLAKN